MEAIWKKKATLDEINQFCKKTMVEHIDINFIEIGQNFISATMPVNEKTTQPMGILHGGASVVLAETLGSVASYMTLDDASQSLGLEIKANHLKSADKGLVTGVVTPVHLGKATQVWDISIKNEKEKLICVSRLTMAILRK